LFCFFSMVIGIRDEHRNKNDVEIDCATDLGRLPVDFRVHNTFIDVAKEPLLPRERSKSESNVSECSFLVTSPDLAFDISLRKYTNPYLSITF